MGLVWEKYGVDSELPRLLRKDTRTFRRERGKFGKWVNKRYEGGHRLIYDDLKVIWGAGPDEWIVWAVLSHHADPVWQLWHCDDELGWELISWHHTKREAQIAAELPLPKEPAPPKLQLGTYVAATWPENPAKPMSVRCSSPYTAEVIEGIFTRLGCAVEKKVLA